MDDSAAPSHPTTGIAMLAGALLGTLFEVALLGLSTLLGRWPGLRPSLGTFVAFVFAGGWFAFPMIGAGIAAAISARPLAGRARLAVWTWAAMLCAFGLLGRPAIDLARVQRPPQGQRQKVLAITRLTFKSPQTVARILPYANDPDPIVREQAMLSLGENLLVNDIEKATGNRPPRWPTHPLRERMAAILRSALAADSSEGVRGEAARALWKAPHAYGPTPAAAETLAALLDRATRPDAPERLAWLALDAAAGAPDSGLRAAAGRFAARTRDPELARVARIAATGTPAR